MCTYGDSSSSICGGGDGSSIGSGGSHGNGGVKCGSRNNSINSSGTDSRISILARFSHY